jgi:hypothetical protein
VNSPVPLWSCSAGIFCLISVCLGLFPLTEYYSLYQLSTNHSTSRTPSITSPPSSPIRCRLNSNQGSLPMFVVVLLFWCSSLPHEQVFTVMSLLRDICISNLFFFSGEFTGGGGWGCSLFVWLISHQPTVLFSQNKPATSNQPTVLFSHNKSAPATNQTNSSPSYHRCLHGSPSWVSYRNWRRKKREKRVGGRRKQLFYAPFLASPLFFLYLIQWYSPRFGK